VSFLLYYLTLSPETIEQIYEETAHIGDVVMQEDLSQVHFTRAAIHEAFRMTPTAFALARILEEDIYLSGYHLKAGVSQVSDSIWNFSLIVFLNL
jgi:cytochrome P450